MMLPFTPHIAHECLEQLKCKNVDKWPEVKKELNEQIKFAIQINGKTRDIISIKKNDTEEKITEQILKSSISKKYIENKKILRTIFVKNKIINYIIK